VSSTSSTKTRRSGLGLFLRQVIAELRKVVRPTRNQLITYTSVVLVFVLAVMAYVSVLDFGFGKLVLWAFGGGS
jgi:preprotein translocase subunit SecE